MQDIYVVERITGAGWDCDTVGFFSSQIRAINALKAHFEKRGLKGQFDHSTTPAGKPYIECFIKNQPYYLEYRISKGKVDELKE